MPSHPETPRGINHVVLNVRDLERSHRFWTEVMGFRCVGALKAEPGRPRPKMRFYSGVSADGQVTHHDIALMEMPPANENANGETRGDRGTWSLVSGGLGLNHVAVAWPDRESWLRQLEFLREKGVTFHRRVNHGMTHSVYISDPDGHGIEVLYELPREVWGNDIDAAQNYVENLPTDGPESLADRTDNPTFTGTAASAAR